MPSRYEEEGSENQKGVRESHSKLTAVISNVNPLIRAVAMVTMEN